MDALLALQEVDGPLERRRRAVRRGGRLLDALDAVKLALLGDGEHSVSLDKVISTMKRTGADMNAIYKETSLGGLAVNVVEC